ncbi:MAG: hypothetical protein V4672_13900 [Verrucomicrobiota bacterium]
MKLSTHPFPASLSRDLLASLLLLTVATLGGWMAAQAMEAKPGGSVQMRLLIVLLVHPFSMAAWIFCGLPGLALAVKSLLGALEQRRTLAVLLSTGLLALSLACAKVGI